MFTSGSTGAPKCVEISHDNVDYFINWSINEFEIRRDDVLSGLNPAHFDNSIFDFFLSIFRGSSLIPINADQLADPLGTIRLLRKGKCTTWFSVPSLLTYYLSLKLVSDSNFMCFNKIIFGGEGFPKTKLKLLYDQFSARIDFYNVYGPTECTCMCSSHKVTNRHLSHMVVLYL